MRVLVGVIVETRLLAAGATSVIGQKRGSNPPYQSSPHQSSLHLSHSAFEIVQSGWWWVGLFTATVWGWRVGIGPRFPHSLPLPKLRMPAPPRCTTSLIDHPISSCYAPPLHCSSPFLIVVYGCTTAPSLLVTAPARCRAAAQTVNHQFWTQQYTTTQYFMSLLAPHDGQVHILGANFKNKNQWVYGVWEGHCKNWAIRTYLQCT